MIEIQKHLSLLGHRVTDKVTGFEGVVTSISFDLFGCIQAAVNPGLDANKKPIDGMWFDVNRLAINTTTRVMEQPKFNWTDESVAKGEKGPAQKPLSSRF